ncbi:glycoside hydrolase family 88 protein [Halorubrum trueperi]|uniref:Glycoside hydrolase family 88 protein n=1 Tax=Halorubrum trueperi TaxID=2004704 RepID=A0ABD5UPQ2_9EURY
MVPDSPLDDYELLSALDAIVDRILLTLDEMDGAFPFVADPETGAWDTTTDGNWCGGHWIGLLWIASDVRPFEADRIERAARTYTDQIVQSPNLRESMFGGMNYHYAGFRAYDITGDRSQFGIGLTGADSMVSLYDKIARQIPVGEYTIEGPQEQFEFSEGVGERVSGTRISAVDMIYTSVPVLWRAYHETSDPRFRDIAVSHCDRHLDWYLREDGSTWQEAQFDPQTGRLERQYNDLAYDDDTCWARGQGWNIAGLARAYSETGAQRYLDTLVRSVEYYVDHSPDDLVPYWDFEVPTIPDAPRDTSAAALAAYGLVRLEGDSETIEELQRTGEGILASIIDSYLVQDASDPRHGMILEGCYDKPGEYAVDYDLIWTDYYVAYLLWSLLGESS